MSSQKTIADIRQKLHGVLDQYDKRMIRLPAILGDGAGNVEVDGRPNFVYIRTSDGMYAGQVFNNRAPLVDDQAVFVGYTHEQPNLYQVLSIRETSVGVSSSTPALSAHDIIGVAHLNQDDLLDQFGYVESELDFTITQIVTDIIPRIVTQQLAIVEAEFDVEMSKHVVG